MKQCIINPLPRQIYQTSLRLQGHSDELLKPFDLTLEQFHSLKIVFSESGAVGQKDLCTLAAKTPANMTRILDRLAAKNFIRRETDPNDRRAFIIKITNIGENIVNEVAEIFGSYLEKILAGIPLKDEQICQKVLEQINLNLATIIPEASN